jgi:hypothetical protein
VTLLFLIIYVTFIPYTVNARALTRGAFCRALLSVQTSYLIRDMTGGARVLATEIRVKYIRVMAEIQSVVYT